MPDPLWVRLRRKGAKAHRARAGQYLDGQRAWIWHGSGYPLWMCERVSNPTQAQRCKRCERSKA